MNDENPLDADDLMNFSERIEQLPLADADWVGALFQECLRARMHEAELLSATLLESSEDGEGHQSANTFDAQLAQVALDAAEWLKTLWSVGYMGAGSFPSKPCSAFPLVELEDVIKSALFARIRQGKRPLPFPPPTRGGLPWHALVECEESEEHAVDAEILSDDLGQAISARIEDSSDWQIREEISPNSEYLVQHRGKGPVFRLRLDIQPATLHREPPSWSRRIVFQDRGGFKTYVLEWPEESGRTLSVPLRAATWERAESEAGYWIAGKYPEMYGQVSFERVDA
jgi:hypothetical protein